VASTGVWSAGGIFEQLPAIDTRQLMLLYRHHVLKNLLAYGRIGQATRDILDHFHHPGFSAYEGENVAAGDSAAHERLRGGIVSAPFSLARSIITATPALSPASQNPPHAGMARVKFNCRAKLVL
jgi:hypothetical protein